MPATSKTQQRLMGAAYSVKSGDMKLSDVDSAYRDKVKELVDSMTLQQLKDFASTSHAGLPEEVKEDMNSPVTPLSVQGMGAVKLPQDGTVGSGDIPMGCEKDPEGNQKCKKILTFDDFIKESLNENVDGDLSGLESSLDMILPKLQTLAKSYEQSILGEVFYKEHTPKNPRVRNQAEMIYKAIQSAIKGIEEASYVLGNVKSKDI